MVDGVRQYYMGELLYLSTYSQVFADRHVCLVVVDKIFTLELC